MDSELNVELIEKRIEDDSEISEQIENISSKIEYSEFKLPVTTK